MEPYRIGLKSILIDGLRPPPAKPIPYCRELNRVVIGNHAASTILAKYQALSTHLFPPSTIASRSTKANHSKSPGRLIAHKRLLGKYVLVVRDTPGVVKDFVASHRASQPQVKMFLDCSSSWIGIERIDVADSFRIKPCGK
jgi:hypothetical protein